MTDDDFSILKAVMIRHRVQELQMCMPEPFGCGGDANFFKDELSRKEYAISALCQKCQDSIFTPEEDK